MSHGAEWTLMAMVVVLLAGVLHNAEATSTVQVSLEEYIQEIVTRSGIGPTLYGFNSLLNVLENSECTNCEEEGLYDTISVNPYAMVNIENHALQVQENVDCYVEVLSYGNESSPQLVYRLTSDLADTEDESGENSNGEYLSKFVTHTGQCGACSTVQSLAVYIRTRETMTDLTKSCAMSSLIDYLTFGLSDIEIQNGMECMGGTGLKYKCRDIWFWNTISTAQGCAATCFGYRNSAPNEATKVTCGKLNAFCHLLNKNFCETCQNTVNGENICKAYMYENGPFRLNPCLQCDECRSGPLFQAVAARTRRASNIKSSINRPLDDSSTSDLERVSWNYGYNVVL